MKTTSLSRREFLRLMGVGSAAATLTQAGCAVPPPPPAATAVSPAAPAATTAAPVAAKEFTFTSWSLNEAASKDILTEFITNYEKKAGAKAKLPTYPYNEYLNQLVLQARGGNATGAAQLDVAWLATCPRWGSCRT